MEIKSFEELITPSLKDGQKFLSYECKRLLPSGEHYGSLMLRVQYTILNENGQEEVQECVAKLCPPNEYLWEAYSVRTTFKKEIVTYNTIIPAFKNFGKEMGIDSLLDFFPICFAARMSLDSKADEIDNDAVLLMKNLSIEGYGIGDRFVGFDYDTAKLGLQNIATLHATAIAFKKANPSEFKEKMLPHLKSIIYTMEEGETQGLIDRLVKAAALNNECVPHLSKLQGLADNMNQRRITKFDAVCTPDINEPFATFSHNDYWLNNTMFKYENGKQTKQKLIDFQAVSYSSIGHDVVFFIYSSVAIEVLENHVDELFEIYYDKFIEILTQLKCDTTPYTFQAMMDEFGAATRADQFLHLGIMMFPIMLLKNNAKDIGEMSGGDFAKDKNAFHDNFVTKTQLILLDLVKRGWI